MAHDAAEPRHDAGAGKMVEPVDDFGLIEIELLGDRAVGLLDQRQAVLDRRQDAAIARIRVIVAARAGRLPLWPGARRRAESRARGGRP